MENQITNSPATPKKTTVVNDIASKKLKKSKNRKLYLSGLVLLLLVIGSIAAYILTFVNQDVRQQASSDPYYVTCQTDSNCATSQGYSCDGGICRNESGGAVQTPTPADRYVSCGGSSSGCDVSAGFSCDQGICRSEYGGAVQTPTPVSSGSCSSGNPCTGVNQYCVNGACEQFDSVMNVGHSGCNTEGGAYSYQCDSSNNGQGCQDNGYLVQDFEARLAQVIAKDKNSYCEIQVDSCDGMGISLIGNNCGTATPTGSGGDGENPEPTLPPGVTPTTPPNTPTPGGPMCHELKMFKLVAGQVADEITGTGDSDLKPGDQARFICYSTGDMTNNTYKFRVKTPGSDLLVPLPSTGNGADYLILQTGEFAVQCAVCDSAGNNCDWESL